MKVKVHSRADLIQQECGALHTHTSTQNTTGPNKGPLQAPCHILISTVTSYSVNITMISKMHPQI